jgi:hypothetical protein
LKIRLFAIDTEGSSTAVGSRASFTAENYSIAWNQLVGRYENKKLIAATYFRQLLGLKNSSKEDVGKLRQFITHFVAT